MKKDNSSAVKNMFSYAYFFILKQIPLKINVQCVSILQEYKRSLTNANSNYENAVEIMLIPLVTCMLL